MMMMMISECVYVNVQNCSINNTLVATVESAPRILVFGESMRRLLSVG
jgi:hypothetical protein